jgi:hypothetical protein
VHSPAVALERHGHLPLNRFFALEDAHERTFYAVGAIGKAD